MCVDSTGLNGPVAMESDGPLTYEEVHRLKKTVTEEVAQVTVRLRSVRQCCSRIRSPPAPVNLIIMIYSETCYDIGP